MSALLDTLRSASRDVSNERYVAFADAIETVDSLIDALSDITRMAKAMSLSSGTDKSRKRIERAEAVLAKAKGGSK